MWSPQCWKGVQPKEAAARGFRVGRSTVHRWVEAALAEGRLEAKPMRGGPEPTIRGEGEAALKRLVAADNHLTLGEYRDRRSRRQGSGSTPGRSGGPSGASG